MMNERFSVENNLRVVPCELFSVWSMPGQGESIVNRGYPYWRDGELKLQ